MRKDGEAEWVAHVTYANRHMVEVIVRAPSGSQHIALQKVTKQLGLTGANDPKVMGILIQEASKPGSKRHEFGGKRFKEEEVTPTMEVKRDEGSKFDHKYEVRLFINPQVSTMRKFRIGAANPIHALNAARGMAGVEQIKDLGPWCVLERVERYDKDKDLKYEVLVTKSVKGPAAFPDIGPLNTSGTNYRQPIPGSTIPPRPLVGQGPPPTWKEDEFVKDVVDILSKETKALRKQYTIKQDK